ncbi:MAG: class II fructose-bisphosphate aldolase [Bacillota bacterium]
MAQSNTRTEKTITGLELRALFDRFCPFSSDLSLRRDDQRKTVLAVNGNYPLEIEVAGFYHAASLDGGSPMIVQISGGALETLGRALRPNSLSGVADLRQGARLFWAICQSYESIYSPGFVALGLDHFAVPDIREALFADNDPDRPQAPCPSGDEVRRRLREAIMAAERCGMSRPSLEDTIAYEAYLCSQEYRQALMGFMGVIEEMKPAWAMIDTGETPPVLNFAVTREVVDMVREQGSDAIIEAEFGATGQAGAEDTYEPLSGQDLAEYARQVAGFVQYTGAEGISYPIGMEHAAPTAVKHEPDVARLEHVQREIIRVTGRYVPFAQHGGTGAKEIARGLVGKNNVNTHFLVTAAQSFAMHVAKYKEGIAQGRKSASGTAMYLSAARAVMDATVDKLKECGTYGALAGW